MPRPALALIALALLVHTPLLDAQAPASLTTPPSASWLPALRATVRAGTLTAPDSIGSGWTRLALVKEGRHVIVLFRLRDGVEPATFLAALDTARMTPSTGIAVGGPEVARNAEVVMDLPPGRYVLACMVRDTPASKRHLSLGESRVIVVGPRRGASRAASRPPTASTEVHMFDFAYRAPERWRRGPQWLRVSSEGKDDHLLLVGRLRDGATLREWAASKPEDSVATALTGVSRTGPGGVVYLPVALAPGRYVIYCRITHGASGLLHQTMGMFKEIVVE